MEKNHDLLPLGTAESAVRSCVSVLAAVTAQREDILAYWLDLYYQVRRAYEIEQENEEDPRLIRADDLYPVMREIWREALKSTAKEKNKKKDDVNELTPAEFKRQVAAELDEVRLAGVPIPAIAAASGGKITDSDILSIAEKKRMPLAVYNALHGALEKVRAE